MIGPWNGLDGKVHDAIGKTFELEFCTVARWQNGEIAEENRSTTTSGSCVKLACFDAIATPGEPRATRRQALCARQRYHESASYIDHWIDTPRYVEGEIHPYFYFQQSELSAPRQTRNPKAGPVAHGGMMSYRGEKRTFDTPDADGNLARRGRVTTLTPETRLAAQLESMLDHVDRLCGNWRRRCR